MSVLGFLLILVTTALVLVGTLFPGAGPVPFFVHTWWFIALGGLLVLGNVIAVISAWAGRKWPSLVSHLGALLLFIGIARDARTIEITAELTPGERITTYNIHDVEKPLGFALQLVDFTETGYVSRIRLDDGPARPVRPSHPVKYQGWLILQDRYQAVPETSRFVLSSETGETLRVTTGQRFKVPGRDYEMEFNQDFVMARDTLFRFELYAPNREAVTGFLSRHTVLPPTIKPGVKLVDFSAGSKYVSILQLVKRPGAGLSFLAFALILAGLLTIAIKETQVPAAAHEVGSGVRPSAGIWRVITTAIGLVLAVGFYFLTSVGRVSSSEFRLGWVAFGLYALSGCDYLVAFLKRRRGRSYPGDILFGLALAAHLLAVVARGRVAGHLPFATRFEAMLFYAFATALLTWLVNFFRKDLPVALLTLPVIILFMLGTLLGGDRAPKPLPPVLNSPFFAIHVIVAFLGYAFYTLNFSLAIGGLLARADRPGPAPTASANPILSRLGAPMELLGLARQLVPWGLLLLGAAIGLGGIWAMFSWGNWWGWDPKENAALVTWLGYLAFLHAPARLREPRKSDAIYFVVGYVLLIVTFLGVNLLKRGLHAYQ